MNPSAPTPQLPMWIFFVADAVLLGTASFIAATSPRPLPASTMLWVVALVFAGVMVALLPLLVRYERQRSELFDERQRALEALAATVTSSAEQLGIAAAGLHQIAELAQKNLRQAEQLPHKLQDKIAEFQAQLSNANDTEREELEKQLADLRGSETERLESLSDKLAKTAAELARLEATTHQHLTATNEAVAKLALGANALGSAQTAVEQALRLSNSEATRSLRETPGMAAPAIESAKSAAPSEIDARFAAAGNVAANHPVAEFSQKIPQPAGLEHALTGAEPAAPVHGSTTGTGSNDSPAPESLQETTPNAAAAPSEVPPPLRAEPAAPAGKRPRKSRRDETPGESAPAHPIAVPEAPPLEPPPIPVSSIPEIAPIAPATAEPFSGRIATIPPAQPVIDAPGSHAVASPPSDNGPVESAGMPARHEPRRTEPARRRTRKADTNGEPALGLELDESSPAAPGVVERVLTSDGSTRVLVTAYIGIGNRLFIRGDGPGLSWDKGVPLQFVSIGKWRWQSNEASAPVRFKLFKNDELECTGLGTQTLDPGYQQEVSAAF